MADKAHLLVTNDDGIDSFFLRVLVEAMVEKFRLTVVAPMGEQSWIGRAMSRSGEVHLADYEKFPCRAYALDGTPGDCVNIAIGHLLDGDPPEAVVSGINLGFNVTLPLIFSSGTIGGALEGAFKGLPAFAFSHQVAKQDYERLRQRHGEASGALAGSLRHAGARARELVAGLFRERSENPVVHNINFPVATRPDTEVVRTIPAPLKLAVLFAREAESTFRFRFFEAAPADDPRYDFTCINAGRISHSVLDFSRIGCPG